MLQNILAFAAANEAAGRPVDFTIQMRIDRPRSEVRAAADFRRVVGAVGAERIIWMRRGYGSWGGKITQDQLPGTMHLRERRPVHGPRISPCAALYYGPMVYCDGRVGACGCIDVDARDLIIGDANVSHIADIWLGEEIRRLREEFLTPNITPLCASCTHYGNASVYLRRSNAALGSATPVPVHLHRTAASGPSA